MIMISQLRFNYFRHGGELAEFAWIIPILIGILLFIIRKQLFPGLYRDDDDRPPKG
ncbi:hypothetical protein [Roseovarius mucosus]|uniref:hypothetical protein n=1 Tax=Roseovarius mucosus TaxID=215743 RepID=UPI00198085D7|nr:hypothetical protein [Roseovarius mucosus]